MTRVLMDTAVFVYAMGREHPYREPCRAIVERAGRGDMAAEASIELVQEFAHLVLRRSTNRTRALEQVAAVAELCRLHAFEPSDLPLTMTLLHGHERLDVRDAAFAATALNRHVGVILSPDRAFDGIRGLRRVDPLDETSVAAL